PSEFPARETRIPVDFVMRPRATNGIVRAGVRYVAARFVPKLEWKPPDPPNPRAPAAGIDARASAPTTDASVKARMTKPVLATAGRRLLVINMARSSLCGAHDRPAPARSVRGNRSPLQRGRQ